MDAFRIQGGHKLCGTVHVSGSKNAALPIMATALLAEGRCTLHAAPVLADIQTLARVLEHMGVVTERQGHTLHLDATHVHQLEAPYELVRTMRASILVLGPLLARFGQARVSLPGGCAIGARPIDQHLKGLIALGAKIELEHGYVIAHAPDGLKPGEIVFDMPTVTGTENLMLAAALIPGQTVLKNAAQEPEIVDLAQVLQKMGADVQGAGTRQITIIGQKKLKPYTHKVIADRIECGTFLVAGALAGAPLTIEGGIAEHQSALIGKLRAIGAQIQIEGDVMRVQKPQTIEAVNIQTAPYPGIATDTQAQLMTLLSVARGTSVVTETIFENRFMHVAELDRLGAHIRVDGKQAIVQGVPQLSGSTVMATDLRASACLVLAGLIAEGQTLVRRIYHLDRGYEALEKKLNGAGAQIERIRE